MYIVLNKHIGKKGPGKDQVNYWFLLSAYQGGLIWARSPKYKTIEAARKAAGDLFMFTLPWQIHPAGELTLFSAEVPIPDPLQPQNSPGIGPRMPVVASGGVRMCFGVGAGYPHRHGSLSHCPDCSEEWPVLERKQAQVASEAPTPPLPTQEGDWRPPNAD